MPVTPEEDRMASKMKADICHFCKLGEANLRLLYKVD